MPSGRLKSGVGDEILRPEGGKGKKVTDNKVQGNRNIRGIER